MPKSSVSVFAGIGARRSSLSRTVCRSSRDSALRALLLAAVALLVALPASGSWSRALAQCRPPRNSNEARLLAFYSVPIVFSADAASLALPPGALRLSAEGAFVPTPSATLQHTDYCYTGRAENTSLTRFDVIIVLGFPADSDGTPSAVIRDRVSTAVHLRQAGLADYLLMSGGAAHNAFRESDVMADLARAQGVPADRIVRDGLSVNSYQNLLYSVELMRQHGWSSALIVTSPAHVPRAARMAAEYPIAYRRVASEASRNGLGSWRVAIRQYERLQQTRVVLLGLPANAGLTADQIRLAAQLRRGN